MKRSSVAVGIMALAGVLPANSPAPLETWRGMAVENMESRWPGHELSDAELDWLEFATSADSHADGSERRVARAVLLDLCAGPAQDHLAGGFVFPAYGGKVVLCVGCNGPGKFLSENSRLVLVFLQAYRATDQLEFALAARDILDWMARDMVLEDGSLSAREEDEIGLWTKERVVRVLGPTTAAEFFATYKINGELRIGGLERTSAWTPEGHARLAGARERLLEARLSERTPYRAGVATTAAHARAISAFARGGEVLLQPKYKGKARELAEFLLRHKRADGNLPGLPIREEEKMEVPPDASWWGVMALLDLHAATREQRCMDEAIALADAAWKKEGADGEGAARALAELARSRDPALRALWVPKALAALQALPVEGHEAERALVGAILKAGGGADAVGLQGPMLAELFLSDAPIAPLQEIPFVLTLTIADELAVGPGRAEPGEAAATLITARGVTLSDLRWPRAQPAAPMANSARRAYYMGEIALRGILTVDDPAVAEIAITCTPCIGGDCGPPVDLAVPVPSKVIPPSTDRHAQRFLDPEGSGAKELVNTLVRYVGIGALLLLAYFAFIRILRFSRQQLDRRLGRDRGAESAPRIRFRKPEQKAPDKAEPAPGVSDQDRQES